MTPAQRSWYEGQIPAIRRKIRWKQTTAFRRACPELAEEREQAALAMTWHLYVKACRNGATPSVAWLVGMAMRRLMVGAEIHRDSDSSYCPEHARSSYKRLTYAEHHDDDPSAMAYEPAESREMPPALQAQLAIDFAAALDALCPAYRKVGLALLRGEEHGHPVHNRKQWRLESRVRVKLRKVIYAMGYAVATRTPTTYREG